MRCVLMKIVVVGSTCVKKFSGENVDHKRCILCFQRRGRHKDICTNCKTKLTKDETKVYFKVRYEDKDDAKLLGARWSSKKRRWYAPNGYVAFLLSKKWKSF